MMSSERPYIESDDATMQLLQGVDHNHCAHLTRAFDIMADKLGGVSNSTALWSIATLLSKILAAATDHEGMQEQTAERFARMLKAAYPVMVRALEDVRRREDGRPPFDA